MTITTLAIVNGALALLMLAALAAVFRLGLGIDRTSNEASVVPAAPTPLDLHLEELAEAA
jgi:hypothetical protein